MGRNPRNGDTTTRTLPCVEDPMFWETFVAQRIYTEENDEDQSDAKDDVTKKGAKGREIRLKDCNVEEKKKFKEALSSEWKKWVKYGAARLIPPEQAKDIDRQHVITARVVYTDKNERTRIQDPNTPMHPKARMCAQMAQHVVCYLSVVNDWPLGTGDIESAYFQGYDLTREVYIIPPADLDVPRGSLMQAAADLWLRRRRPQPMAEIARRGPRHRFRR
jgi:hypothetical protein